MLKEEFWMEEEEGKEEKVEDFDQSMATSFADSKHRPSFESGFGASIAFMFHSCLVEK